MNKELIIILVIFIFTSFVSTLIGFGFGFESGDDTIIELTNGCHVYNNELYCPIFESVETTM